MENFVYSCPTKIIFGKGTENLVGSEVSKYGKKVLLHYGGGSIKKSGLYDRVLKSLKNEGLEIIELGGVQPNPRLSLVREGIDICRREKVDIILAVGGGSVIDSAKTIAAGVPYDGDVWDFFMERAEPEKRIPIGVVLTIAASGSESSNSAVITNEDGMYKKGFNSELLRPDFAILNPELTFSLPPHQTACGASDIMAHIMERYFTRVRDVELTDRLCEAALKTVINNTPVVLREPENYAARAEIMWTGTIAHNNLLDTGRIGDWASHKIEMEISGLYDLAHGAGLAIIFPAWMKYVYKNDIERFARFAVRVWDVEPDFYDIEKVALEGIKKLENFFREIGLPVTLKEANIPYDRFDEMARKCTEMGPVGNFIKLNKDDVLKILEISK
ncbi:MAG: iron-containing alcohol dehydrogenase [Candidatus Humimicrobiaceae bacterium]|jgi:alcohol dehydrogenase YqhD (iron-dependent ADH family)|nr:iron-containing alcohol dehydrogenase [Candidatus Humimicrobiaceae bacterium]